MRTLLSPRGCLLVGLVAAGAFSCHPSCSGSAPFADAALDTAAPDAAAPRPEGSRADAATFATGDAGEPPLAPLCTAILQEEKLDAAALRTEDRTRPGPRVHCVASPRAAWAVRVDPPDGGRSVRQTLIFAGVDGARARRASTLDNVEWPPVLGRHSAMFDFDGDGIPEFFSVVADVRTLSPMARNLVTYKGGEISPYPTGGGYVVDSVADLDADGHGDLHVSFELGKRTVCEPGDEGQIKVELVAHGLVGGKFSLTDSAASAFAARRCPSMPAADAMFLPSVSRALDPRDLSLSYVACSRLRGKSADAVVAELQSACAPHADATKKCSGPCRHLRDAVTVANFPPPVQAKDPPGADAGPIPR